MAALFVHAPADLIALRKMVLACPWYRVYDVIEAFQRDLMNQDKQAGIPVEGAPLAPSSCFHIVDRL